MNGSPRRTASAGAPRSMQDIKERARERALPGLELRPRPREPLGLSFRSASLREAYLALGKAAGVNFVFDPPFQDPTSRSTCRTSRFEQALSALAGRRPHLPPRDRRAGDDVVPDTPSQAPRVRAAGGQDPLPLERRPQGDDRPAAHRARRAAGGAPARRNALTISDTPDKVAAAERIVEVARQAPRRGRGRGRDPGGEPHAPQGVRHRDHAPGSTRGHRGHRRRHLPRPRARCPPSTTTPYRRTTWWSRQLPGVDLPLAGRPTPRRALLANPQLRTREGQTAQARFGDQVPVPVTTFTQIAHGRLPSSRSPRSSTRTWASTSTSRRACTTTAT